MRQAPSVIYPVEPCFFHAALLLALAGAGLLVWLGWLLWGSTDLSTPAGQLACALGAGLWLVWAGFAVRNWRAAPSGCLQWDAQASPESARHSPGIWRWHRQAQPLEAGGAPLQQVVVVLDAQTLLLLRLRNPDGAQRWLWLQRRSDPARWDDLRRALTQSRPHRPAQATV